MPPKFASLIILILIIFLFYTERKNDSEISKAIWIPFSWIFFTNSDKILVWLNLVSPNQSVITNAYIEGNPLGRTVYTILIIIGILILIKNRVNWRILFTENYFIWLYLLFGALSIFWSDFPYVSLKRLIKASGVVIMALIILTERRPYAAIGTLIKRISILLLPLSVLFIKYYPQYGRTYHKISGEIMYTGIASTKNSLGLICLIAGIYITWSILFGQKDNYDTCRRMQSITYIILIPIIIWIFYLANSATSIVCMFFALCLLVSAKFPIFSNAPRRFIVIGILVIFLFGILEYTLDIKNTLIVMLGRRPDLTNRAPMWEHLLSMVVNPLLGAGYESFWLGKRLLIIQQRWGPLIQAHNGYLEMYLNMGIVGLLFLFSWIVIGLKRAIVSLHINYSGAILRLCFILIISLYNITEAVFYGVSTLWMIFLFAIFYYSNQSYTTT